MAFQNQPGCGCCGEPPCNTGSAFATLTICGNNATGVSWTIKLGGTAVATGSTPNISVSGLSPGVYDLDVDAYGATHYHTTFTINSSCTAVNLGTISLTLASGFVCCSGVVRQDTYYFTDSNGIHALVWDGLRWSCCVDAPSRTYTLWTNDSGACGTATGVIPYFISMTCITAGGNVRVVISFVQVSKCDLSGNEPTGNAACGRDPLGSSPVYGISIADHAHDLNTSSTFCNSNELYNFSSASIQTLTYSSTCLLGLVSGPFTISR